MSLFSDSEDDSGDWWVARSRWRGVRCAWWLANGKMSLHVWVYCWYKKMMEKMNCLSIQREGKLRTLYMKEREGKPNANCQSRSPMPSTSAELSSSPWGQARPTGASEADRGKWGRQGQARLVGTGEANGGSKLPGQIPSRHSPFGPRLSRQMKQCQTNKRKSKILLHVPNPIQSKSKENQMHTV